MGCGRRSKAAGRHQRTVEPQKLGAILHTYMPATTDRVGWLKPGTQHPLAPHGFKTSTRFPQWSCQTTENRCCRYKAQLASLVVRLLFTHTMNERKGCICIVYNQQAKPYVTSRKKLNQPQIEKKIEEISTNYLTHDEGVKQATLHRAAEEVGHQEVPRLVPYDPLAVARYDEAR